MRFSFLVATLDRHAQLELEFFVVGMTDMLQKNLRHAPGIDEDILRKAVTFFGYVSSKQLADLYRQCSFVLYPTKSEGYGLPMLDALMYDKPVVASRVTSVPEVLGSAACYIDPYDTDSICEGIACMSREENQRKYRAMLQRIRPMVQARYTADTAILVERILGDIENP